MMIPAHALVGVLCIHFGWLISKGKKGWLWLGLVLAFLSHAIIDALAIFTYHDGSPRGSIYSQFVFWFWLLIATAVVYWALRKDRRYGYGIFSSLSFDVWDHWILRSISCVSNGFADGCMDMYAYRPLHLHHLEWRILDTVFGNTERHYGDEPYFILELLFVSVLCISIAWLRKYVPLPSKGN